MRRSTRPHGGPGTRSAGSVRTRPVRASGPEPLCNQTRRVKHPLWALLKGPDDLKASQLDVLYELRRDRSTLYRCWQLKEATRDRYHLKKHPTRRAPRLVAGLGGPAPHPGRRHLVASSLWLNSACRIPNSRV